MKIIINTNHSASTIINWLWSTFGVKFVTKKWEKLMKTHSSFTITRLLNLQKIHKLCNAKETYANIFRSATLLSDISINLHTYIHATYKSSYQPIIYMFSFFSWEFFFPLQQKITNEIDRPWKLGFFSFISNQKQTIPYCKMFVFHMA